MDSVDLQVLKSASEWVKAGRRVVLATVIRTWGSAPRPIGALTAIRDDGMVVGSVSGGCIEDDMIEQVRAGRLVENSPATTRYGVSAEEAKRFGLPCGGTLELVLEPPQEICVHARGRGGVRPAPTQARRAVDQRDRVAPQRGDARRLQARGPTAGHQHRAR